MDSEPTASAGGVTSTPPSEVARRELFGVPIAAMTMDQALALVDDAVRERTRLQIGVVNAAKIVNMRRDPVLRDDVLSSDLILADGIAVVWAARLLGRPLPERVAGIDLMLGMLGNPRGYRVFCLGATSEVLDRACARIAADFPQAVIAGRHHGYFAPDEEEAVAAEVAGSRADVLFVAMTSPKKEKFMARWSATMGVPVCHGVGGSFDVLAGKARRAPQIWQKLGLEWLYRVKEEPGRLWKRYLVTNTLFCGMLLAALVKRVGVRAEAPGPVASPVPPRSRSDA
jgi:N-acetylglucosaminyldiphosphoundecaprenol N-acetyl-beta-D-mannosaminyltransferase